MYAIVEIAGQQFKVEQGRWIFVHRLEAEEGAKITIDKVLLTDNGSVVKVGTPVLTEARVEATVMKHLRADKVLVFKKKRRKGYRVKNGHRQDLTQIMIDSVA